MTKTELTIDTKKLMATFAIAFLFVVGIVSFAAWITKKTSPSNPTSTPVIEPYVGVTCPADKDSYQKLVSNPDHIIKLISSRKKMFANRNGFVNTQVIVTKSDTQQSKVACGYLYVKAATSSGPIGALKDWEYIYINPDQYGGHLDKDNNIIKDYNVGFSELLVPLNRIQYWESNTEIPAGKQTLKVADWTAVFNISAKIKFQIAFNTNDTTGYIDEVSIAYKCWNPVTGEENDGCKLNIDSASDTVTQSIF